MAPSLEESTEGDPDAGQIYETISDSCGEIRSPETDHVGVAEDHVGVAEDAAKMANGLKCTEETVEGCSETLHSLEQRMTYSELVLQLIEENNKQLHELMRRNEEKRQVVKELCDRVAKLVNENRALQEQNYKLMEENLTLTMSLQKQSSESTNGPNYPRTLSFRNMRSKSLSRLKSLILSTFGAESSPLHRNTSSHN